MTGGRLTCWQLLGEWRCFTFAGLAVWLQSEADGAAAADSCHRVMTCAVAATIVHSAGLCRKTRRSVRHSPQNVHNGCRLDPFISPHLTPCMHTGATKRKKGVRRGKRKVSIHYFSQTVARNKEESRFSDPRRGTNGRGGQSDRKQLEMQQPV